jgi:serine/threonine protein kinase
LTCYTLRSGMHASDQNAAGPELVGGCYRIEVALGRGGMARVYRVLDERSGQRLALKQLVAEGDQSAALRSMFEHEYHTLVQLAHPCIVRVFDYGLNALSPYYTMELLEGADAREANRSQALSVRQICVVLRDAASALALIHSRRMVHRDVSPRNLWCTPDGRAKLIDFGTLVAMGLQTQIVGTPPFVPHARELGARSQADGRRRDWRRCHRGGLGTLCAGGHDGALEPGRAWSARVGCRGVRLCRGRRARTAWLRMPRTELIRAISRCLPWL